MRRYCFFVTALWLAHTAPAQTVFPFTAKANRDSITHQLQQQVQTNILLPLHYDNYPRIAGAFWAMELMQYRPVNMHSVIVHHFNQWQVLPTSHQRALLEMLYTLYPKQYVTEIQQVLPNISNSKVRAMAYEYLQLNKIYPTLSAADMVDTLQVSIYRKGHTKERYLTVNELLHNKLLPQQILVVSFQYRNRNKPGFVMIRTPQHEWLKDSTGKVFKATQLARSITNLPYYLTNGNTPQGLYILRGFAVSNNDWIGPTTNLQMQLPFEASASIFFNDSSISWYNGYKQLLTPFADYDALWESYYAGKLGRTEIIAHGTAINPNYYQQQPYYPCTPSLGCLCSPEIWNNDGVNIQSEQLRWIQALKSIGGGYGYLMVVEIAED
jgi:hypothetical protein